MSNRTLLFVAHTPSANLQLLQQAFAEGVTNARCDITLNCRTPAESDAVDVMTADAIVLLTPENLGYMAGAMKDWFDRVYYPVLEEKQGTPLAVIIRAGHDGTGTERALRTITTGLRWRWVQDAMILRGDWRSEWLDDVTQLGEAIATALDTGII